MTRAIVRPPSTNFAAGLTTAGLGRPDHELALIQHERYCAVLRRCGLELVPLPTDARFPDSTFVEDTAVLTPRGAVIARPGAPSRSGEVESIREVLARFYPAVDAIRAPGTLDGGDVCEADGLFFIGLSERTNEAGAGQLATLLERAGYASRVVDIRRTPGLLHLKSGLAHIGERRIVVGPGLAERPEFGDYDRIRVKPGEEYAANCLRVNDVVLIAAGFPALAADLKALGISVVELDVSEFRKMDGGLSCLSLRF